MNTYSTSKVLDILACPLCGGKLIRAASSLVCESGHSYDLARCGYVNLLPPGKEKNARSGDEREMVRARVDFLAKGHYRPISEKAAELLVKYTDTFGRGFYSVADMGAGEGYHTSVVVEEICKNTDKGVVALGFDASKYAAECASKLSRSRSLMPKEGVGATWDGRAELCFFPANIFRTPTADSSFDAALSLFAPVAGEECHRILRAGGKLIVVSSAREHLTELRHAIYDEVRYNDDVPSVPEGFSEVARERLTYRFDLSSREEIESLFVMTPFYYKTTAAGKERLLSHGSLTVTADVNYSVFEAK